MNTKIVIFTIVSLILVIPSVSAQEVSIGEKPNQKLVKVIISNEGDIHVKHIVSSSNSPKQMNLIDGVVQNLMITDEKGEEQLLTIIGNNDAVMIFPSDNDFIIEYDLDNVLSQKDNVWTWNFRYLETTSFIFPEKLDLIFVNDRPVNLDDKNGISCHGCQMILEYSINEPKNIIGVKWEDKEFFVEIRTFADIENFNFNQPTKNITFDVSDEYRFVATIIPSDLLAGPYSILLNDDEILFHEYNNNGTHVWISMKPESSGEITIFGTTVIPTTGGEITIFGTTVIPEYLIIVLLTIGFLIILAVLLVKKFSLH
ncbi:MAG: hypothetical protein OER78_04985 [Nitrosopumilus sp.]|nr:hypothetical protein [Nitrosopumilus sp.]MDH3855258.1 hypothetical protein [Nitrosopumilus sp.]